MDPIIYSYCNYKDSAVGFQMGKVDLKNGKIYRNDSIPQYIIKSFESGLVNKAFGRYPGKENKNYFYLIKEINYLDKYPEPDKYMNIAFECSDLMAYQKIRQFFQLKEPDQISELFGKMVFPDTSDAEFEMKFDTNRLSSFLSEIKETEVMKKNNNANYFLISSLYDSRTSELKDLFKLNKCGYAIYNGKPEQKGKHYLYRFVKKKTWIRLLIIASIILLIDLFFILGFGCLWLPQNAEKSLSVITSKSLSFFPYPNNDTNLLLCQEQELTLSLRSLLTYSKICANIN